MGRVHTTLWRQHPNMPVEEGLLQKRGSRLVKNDESAQERGSPRPLGGRVSRNPNMPIQASMCKSVERFSCLTMHVLTCGTPEQPASLHPNIPLQASMEKSVEPCSPMRMHVLLYRRTTLPRLNSAPRFRASPAPAPCPLQDKGKTRPPVGSAAPSLLAAEAADHAVLADGSLHPPVGGRGFPQTGLFAPPVFDSCLVFCRKGYVDRGGMLTVITILRAFLWRVSMVFG